MDINTHIQRVKDHYRRITKVKHLTKRHDKYHQLLFRRFYCRNGEIRVFPLKGEDR